MRIYIITYSNICLKNKVKTQLIMNILNLRVYTPEKLFLEKEIVKITLNGKEGSFSILPKHVDYISSFNDCIMCYTDIFKRVNFLATNQGIITKVGRNVEISTFHVVVGNSLAELKDNINELSQKSEELTNKDVESSKDLRKIELSILKKIMEYRTIC